MTSDDRQALLHQLADSRSAIDHFRRGAAAVGQAIEEWRLSGAPSAARLERYATGMKQASGVLDKFLTTIDACELVIRTTPAPGSAAVTPGAFSEAIAGVEQLLMAAQTAATRATQANPPTNEEWRQIQEGLSQAADLVAAMRSLQPTPAIH